MTAFDSKLVLGVLASFVGFLAGCQSGQHTMAAPKSGAVVACKECYTEVYKAQHASGSRWGGAVTQTHARHACPDCKTEMSIYTENGMTKVRCAKCAPEGLECDKCLPPKGWTPPPDAAGKTVCRECYDAVTSEHAANPAFAASDNRTIRTYRCPCCNTEMSLYTKDGTLMVRCAACASDGVAWDRAAPTVPK